MSPASTGHAQRRARPPRLSGRATACSTCRRRSCSAATSSTMPAPRSRRCARPACGCRVQGGRAGPDARRMAGAAAAPHAPASSSRSRPRAPSSGSTAATTPTAGARSRRRSAISRSACRARWCWSSACWRPRTATASCAISPGWCGASIGVPIHQDKGVPADEIADGGARAPACRPRRRDSIEDALAAIAPARLRSAAAHPDHRLALSRGRGAGARTARSRSSRRDGRAARPNAKRPRLLTVPAVRMTDRKSLQRLAMRAPRSTT